MLVQGGTFARISAGRRPETYCIIMMVLDTLNDALWKLLDITYLEFGGVLWYQTVGIPPGTKCVGYIPTGTMHIVASMYRFTYEIESLRGLVNEGDHDLAKQYQRVFVLEYRVLVSYDNYNRRYTLKAVLSSI